MFINHLIHLNRKQTIINNKAKLNTSNMFNIYKAWWRNGSASDSRSEGCVFKSRPGQSFHLYFDMIYFLTFPITFTFWTSLSHAYYINEYISKTEYIWIVNHISSKLQICIICSELIG